MVKATLSVSVVMFVVSGIVVNSLTIAPSRQPVTAIEEQTSTKGERPVALSEQPTTILNEVVSTTEQPTTTTTEPVTTTTESVTTTEPTTTTTEPVTTTTESVTTIEPTTTTTEPATTSEPAITTTEPVTTTEPATTTEPTTTTEPATTTEPTKERTDLTTQTVAVTTSAIQSPPYLCYDCDSGNPLGWRNPSCSESGYIDVNINTPAPCSQPCFSRVGLYPAGSVFRGCSTNFYFPEGKPPMPNGCVEDPVNKSYWCFCSSDRCNTHDLSAKSREYIEKYRALTMTTTRSPSV